MVPIHSLLKICNDYSVRRDVVSSLYKPLEPEIPENCLENDGVHDLEEPVQFVTSKNKDLFEGHQLMPG